MVCWLEAGVEVEKAIRGIRGNGEILQKLTIKSKNKWKRRIKNHSILTVLPPWYASILVFAYSIFFFTFSLIIIMWHDYRLRSLQKNMQNFTTYFSIFNI